MKLVTYMDEGTLRTLWLIGSWTGTTQPVAGW